MNTNKEKFLELVTEEDHKIIDDIIYRIKHRKWLKFKKKLHIRWLKLINYEPKRKLRTS